MATTQYPARAVYPVFTPVAPAYSHRRAFRFWISRVPPPGAGIEWNIVATMSSNRGRAMAVRVRVIRSLAVE